jgi:hypothetical protein
MISIVNITHAYLTQELAVVRTLYYKLILQMFFLGNYFRSTICVVNKSGE